MENKIPETTHEWVKTRFKYLENRMHDALDIMYETVFMAQRIDKERNLRMLPGLKSEFPYLIGLFDKIIEDEKKDRLNEQL